MGHSRWNRVPRTGFARALLWSALLMALGACGQPAGTASSAPAHEPVATAATPAAPSTSTSTDAKDIAPMLIDRERQSWAKYVARDLEGSRPALADDYADVQSDGSVLDRAGHLAFVPEANVEWHELDRFNVVRLAPDAAVVTYRARSRDHGSQETYQADVTAGWSLRDGQWMATFYRETPTPPEAAKAE